jgi:hypothetical protein
VDECVDPELAIGIGALAPVAPEATSALSYVRGLRAACDRDGNLPAARRSEVGSIVAMLEARLQ